MFNPNKSPLLPQNDGGRDKNPNKSMTPEVKRRLWTTVILSAVLLTVWYGCMALGEATCNDAFIYGVMIAYSVAFAALLMTYLAYNRAFVNKDVTVDMLPDEWSAEKKQSFVEENRRRAEKSRWMVTVIIPFVVVFLAEALYLFVWEGLLADTLENWGFVLPGGGS